MKKNFTIFQRERLQEHIKELEQEVKDLNDKVHKDDLKDRVKEITQNRERTETLGEVIRKNMK